MTMAEIRKTVKARKDSFKRAPEFEELAVWLDDMQKACEALYRDGGLRGYEISNDLLKLANGFQVRTCNYETFHVNQTYDIRSIYIDDKKTAREFAEFVLLD